MKKLAEKLSRLERTLSQEKGVFNLFALFLREDAPDVWDLVVAAKWIEDDEPAALLEISKRVQAFLSAHEITKISRVVVINESIRRLRRSPLRSQSTTGLPRSRQHILWSGHPACVHRHSAAGPAGEQGGAADGRCRRPPLNTTTVGDPDGRN